MSTFARQRGDLEDAKEDAKKFLLPRMDTDEHR